MDHKRLGVILLAFLLAGMAMAPMASATSITVTPWMSKGATNIMNFGGTGTLSSGTASQMDMSCTLYKGNVEQTYTTATTYNSASVYADGSFYPCVKGKLYNVKCRVYSTNPTLYNEGSMQLYC